MGASRLSWFKKSKEEEDSPTPKEKATNIPIMIRELIYDSLLTPPEVIADLLGLPPISDEVAEMEERASRERLDKFGVLVPFLSAHADVLSKIATSAYLIEIEASSGERPPIEEIEDINKMFRLVSLSATISCLATLMSLGVVITSDKDES